MNYIAVLMTWQSTLKHVIEDLAIADELSRTTVKFPNDHECLPGSDISYNRLEEIRKATEKDGE